MHKALSIREQVTRRLVDLGINPTRQRVEIGACLFDGDKHVSADQVLEMVNQGPYEVSKATVYNTLGLFAGKGLLREVVVTPGKVVYDTNTSDHHHLYNVDTGDLQDLSPEDIQVSRLPELGGDVRIDGIDIIVRVSSKSP